MRGFDPKGAILKGTPPEAIYYTGHHVDHELVENIEVDCADRLARMRNGEPRRFLVTMGGAGAQRELFKAIIEHCVPLVQAGKIALFVNLGDHKDNWAWLEGELAGHKELHSDALHLGRHEGAGRQHPPRAGRRASTSSCTTTRSMRCTPRTT